MDPVTGAAIIGGVGAVAGGLFGASSARAQNKANMAMQRQQQGWQTYMSNTAHYREVQDLKNAGLNPMLSVMGGNGASTGSSQLLEQKEVNPMAGLAEATTNALELQRARKEIDLAKSQEKVNNMDVNLMKDQANKITDERILMGEKTKQEIINTEAIAEEAKARIQTARYLEEQAKQDQKFQKFDNYERRINSVLQGVNNATSIINPLSKIKGFKGASDHSAKSSRNRSYTEERYNSRGEHVESKSRRYHD